MSTAFEDSQVSARALQCCQRCLTLLALARHELIHKSSITECFMTIVFPNSDSVGFQSLGPGSGATKMYAPKNRNSLEPCLQPCCNLAGTFPEPCLQPCSNLAGTLLEPCLHLAGTLLEPSCNLAGTLLATLLEPCLHLAGTLLAPSRNLAGTLLAAVLQPCWNLAATLLQRFWNLPGTLLEPS